MLTAIEVRRGSKAIIIGGEERQLSDGTWKALGASSFDGNETKIILGKNSEGAYNCIIINDNWKGVLSIGQLKDISGIVGTVVESYPISDGQILSPVAVFNDGFGTAFWAETKGLSVYINGKIELIPLTESFEVVELKGADFEQTKGR